MTDRVEYMPGDRVRFRCQVGRRREGDTAEWQTMIGVVQRWRPSSNASRGNGRVGFYDILADHDGIERSVRPSQIEVQP